MNNGQFINDNDNIKDNHLDVKDNFTSLLSLLDSFNLDKDQLSELDNYLKVVGHFFIIAKFGLSKKDQSKMISSIKKEFKKLGLKSTIINEILEDVLNKEKNINLDLNIINEISSDPGVK